MPRFAPLLAFIVVGCTAAGGTDDAGAAAMQASTGSFGVIRVDREMDGTTDVTTPRAVLGAAFARYRAVDGRDVLALLGGRSAELETCGVQGADEGAFAAPDADVELVDVGALEVRVAGTRTEMLARTFPDLAGMVGGVFYAEDATLGAARADVDEYVITAAGGDVSGFEVAAVAPPGLAEIFFDGVPADGSIALDRELGALLEWDAGDPRDRLELEIAAGGQVIECVARDDGSFRIEADTLASLGADESARVIVSRVRTHAFDVAGLDAAWVAVASSRTFYVAVP